MHVYKVCLTKWLSERTHGLQPCLVYGGPAVYGELVHTTYLLWNGKPQEGGWLLSLKSQEDGWLPRNSLKGMMQSMRQYLIYPQSSYQS